MIHLYTIIDMAKLQKQICGFQRVGGWETSTYAVKVQHD